MLCRPWEVPPGSAPGTWYTWSVVLFFFTLTVTVVLSGKATLNSTSETPFRFCRAQRTTFVD